MAGERGGRLIHIFLFYHPANISLFKVNKKNISSKVTIKYQSDGNDVFLWLILNIFHTFLCVTIVNFEKVKVSWARHLFEEPRRPLIKPLR